MSALIFRRMLILLALLAVAANAAETLPAAIQRATGEYEQRLRQAAEELARTRTRIADEKAPLAKDDI